MTVEPRAQELPAPDPALVLLGAFILARMRTTSRKDRERLIRELDAVMAQIDGVNRLALLRGPRRPELVRARSLAVAWWETAKAWIDVAA